MTVWFVTHAEPVVEPRRPIGSWGLSAVGRARAAAWRAPVARVIASPERKAVETAELVAGGGSVEQDPALIEVDRSATGYLPFDEFDAVVDAFFDRPTESVRGWERAVDAQERIVEAVRALAGPGAGPGAGGGVVLVSHGAVGALLLASLTGEPVARTHEQPGMGSVLTLDPVSWRLLSGWKRLPLPA
ncbi:histidine phosphatase family protein [Curtobacterium sp. DN_7.5]|uniref:histidine phosphatase family protein n=2 Tax=unclassified Curtobacterium TaxID=257496 RepID=UPI001F584DB7|nr:histidine phosphatase family protein [Curtobacterium sp. DN_7.5]